MIFPLDVQKRAEDANRVVGENKKQLVVTVFVIANFVFFFAIRYVLNLAGIKSSVGTPIQLLVMVFVGIYVFRFAIFHEDEKKQEYKNKDSDSFARYLALRRDNVREYDYHNERLNIFEYTNGSVVCALEFRFGSNDKAKAIGTRAFYEGLLHLAADYNFTSRITIHSERFEDSTEFKEYVDSINSIEDLTLRKSNLDIAREVLRLADEKSNVDVLTVVLSSKSGYKLDDLQALLRSIYNLLSDSVTAFRAVHSLTIQELREFFRVFYGIEAIDLTMMKTIDLASEIQDEFVGVVETVILRGASGKSYTNMKDLEKTFTVKESKLV